MEGISQRLRIWRKTILKMTQNEFSKLARMNIGMIRKYEQDDDERGLPGAKSLIALSRTGINIHWLLTGQGEMRASSVIGEVREDNNIYAEGISRLQAIEQILSGIEDEKRKIVIDELYSRALEAKRLSELENAIRRIVKNFDK
ncbi:MAG: hypothetical protein KF908_10390 [Nitrosomonas sp.]|uniref:HTH cro/C1-type domain-containing protein n=1 Tax=Nitrosomonas aestuarii TaxID=52441 RepID=A0A1I4CZV9_9PROT|nr:hypothetical protein [Nitrosomonas aestuarii]MBX3630292.1 hypothetical protein [Nitrosomonas sp.]SFK85381.1 hypothetical protein SAMN05216302_101782 [Nitrosomonas aestuarii]